MSLLHWQPMKELDNLRQQMNHLFDEITHSDRHQNLFPTMTDVDWMPTIELHKTDTDIILKAQVPGIDAKDIDIQVTSDAVLIAGEHKEEKQTEEKGVVRSEFQYGQFSRVVPLPVNVKYEQVKSEFKDGVVTLTLPIAETNRPNVFKVDLTQQKARQAMTEERQHNEHLEQTMNARTSAELETPAKNGIQEEARATMTEQLLQNEHLDKTMDSRAATEVGATGKTTKNK
jgi:HSP20 family protein